MNVKCILPSDTQGKSYVDGDKMFLKDITAVSEADGDAVFYSHVYEDIFGYTRKISNNHLKRLSIVEISANGKSIHRAFKSEGVKDISKDDVGLTTNSLRLLNDINGNYPTEVEVSIGRWFPFYWEHPDKSIRISFKLGLLSVVLGIMGFALGICSLIASVVSWIS